MTTENPLLSPKTPKIVGRKSEISAIKQAINDKGSQRILYFVAGGGMGKTRLLEEVERIQKPVLIPPIIDLYHQSNHSPSGLRQAIVKGLGNKKFLNYNQKRLEFEEKREFGKGGAALEEMRAELDKAFIQEYNQISNHQRIILRFDTLELLQYEHDSVQTTCLVDDVNTVIKNWLLEVIPQLKNSVTIFAGRPRPIVEHHAIEDNQPRSVEEEFQIIFSKSDCHFEPFVLPSLDEKECKEFIQLMCQQYPEQLNPIFYSDNPPDIYPVSEGKPIRLAILVDLFRYEQPVNIRLPKEDIDKELVERLMGLPMPIGPAVRFCY
ncbi:MAG: ATP-binding protein [Chloroflexi bacterium]|nr:ATP-binding protein [Chloroflexota bacterium]